jgi:spore coat protein A
MLTRRQLIVRGAAGGASLMVPSALWRTSLAAAAPRSAQLQSYTQALQVPPARDLTAGGAHQLSINAIQRQLHRALSPTSCWSYQDAGATYGGYLGPTLVAKQGKPVTMSYTNNLPYTAYPAWLPVDRNFTPGHKDEIRTLTHLHGGFVHAQFDGNPKVDISYGKGDTQTVEYANAQQASLLWYHDHGHGTTRLNVFAGLAGAYVLRDDVDTGAETNVNGLPVGYGTGPGNYEIPLAIQDRMFKPTPDLAGRQDFLYPATPQVAGGAGSFGMCGNAPNQYGANTPGPWIGEYFGDEFLVNGLCTPFLNVEPRVYRFRVLNGCNARFLDLGFLDPLHTPPPMWQIGGDGGLFGAPVQLKNAILLAPGERADIIVDFTGRAGATMVLKNTPLPNPYASPAPRLNDVMQVRVGSTVSDNTNNAVPTTLIGGAWANPGAPTIGPRTITLQEWNAGLLHWYVSLTGSGAGGIDVPQGGFGLGPNGTPGVGGNCFDDPISELPPLGEIQDWDFVNSTSDTHPMHVHLVQFQVVHRRAVGAAIPADGTGVLPQEKGWKDTVAAHPGMVTRIRTKFDLPPATTAASPIGFKNADGTPYSAAQEADAKRTYVYHCHIIEHEDNDMMRPFRVA